MCIIFKRWPNKPSKFSRTDQNCTIFKIRLIFGHFFGNKTWRRTNISPEIKAYPQNPRKNILKHDKFPKNGQTIP